MTVLPFHGSMRSTVHETLVENFQITSWQRRRRQRQQEKVMKNTYRR
jgi:hypothetical protein